MFAVRGNAVSRVVRCSVHRPLLTGHHLNRPLSTPAAFKKKQEAQIHDDKVEKPKAPRPARKTSLRRVGLEAEQKRVVVRRRGGIQVIERGIGTRVCLIGIYTMVKADGSIRKQRHTAQPNNTTSTQQPDS
jgi:hypothetical protein